jgi:RNA polymerase sigma-70 factor (ECF subfamily)
VRRARSKLSPSVPLDKDRAHQILFHEKTIALVEHWLDRLGVPAQALGDVSQDVFLAAHHSFPTYDPMRSRPERWLNKITVHVASHYRERAQHRREVLTPQSFFDMIDESPGVDERIRVEQERLDVLDALQDLEVDLRSVVIAHDLDEVPMAEIAAQHGIPLSTAYKWRARALAELAEALEQRRREDER